MGQPRSLGEFQCTGAPVRSRQGRARHIAALSLFQYNMAIFALQTKKNPRASAQTYSPKDAPGRFARALQQPAAGEPKRPRSAAQDQGGWL